MKRHHWTLNTAYVSDRRNYIRTLSKQGIQYKSTHITLSVPNENACLCAQCHARTATHTHTIRLHWYRSIRCDRRATDCCAQFFLFFIHTLFHHPTKCWRRVEIYYGEDKTENKYKKKHTSYRILNNHMNIYIYLARAKKHILCASFSDATCSRWFLSLSCSPPAAVRCKRIVRLHTSRQERVLTRARAHTRFSSTIEFISTYLLARHKSWIITRSHTHTYTQTLAVAADGPSAPMNFVMLYPMHIFIHDKNWSCNSCTGNEGKCCVIECIWWLMSNGVDWVYIT